MRMTRKHLWMSALAALVLSMGGTAHAGKTQGGYVIDRSDLKPIYLPCSSIKVLSEDGERYEPMPTIRCNRFIFIDRHPTQDDGMVTQSVSTGQNRPIQMEQDRDVGQVSQVSQTGGKKIEMATIEFVPAPWSKHDHKDAAQQQW